MCSKKSLLLTDFPSADPVAASICCRSRSSACQEIPPTTFWHCKPYLLCLKTLISILSSLVKTIAFYAKQTRHKNLTKIMSFVTLSAVSILIGIFHTGKFCFWVPFVKKLLLRNHVVDFVEICNVCVRKAIIEAAKRIINSDRVCHSYSDFNFGVTFFGTQCISVLQGETNVTALISEMYWTWPVILLKLSDDEKLYFDDAASVRGRAWSVEPDRKEEKERDYVKAVCSTGRLCQMSPDWGVWCGWLIDWLIE